MKNNFMYKKYINVKKKKGICSIYGFVKSILNDFLCLGYILL